MWCKLKQKRIEYVRLLYPESYIKKCCDFLGIECSNKVIEDVRREQYLQGARIGDYILKIDGRIKIITTKEFEKNYYQDGE